MAGREGTASSSSCSHTPTLYAPFDRHWGRKAGGGVETRTLSCCFEYRRDSTTQTDKNCHSGAPSSASGTPSCRCPSLSNPALWRWGAAHPPNATLAHVSSPPLDFTVQTPKFCLQFHPPGPGLSPTWRSLRTQACFPPQIPYPDSTSIPPLPAAVSEAAAALFWNQD